VKRVAKALALCAILVLPLGAQAPLDADQPEAQPRFGCVEVFVDSGAQPLAAWQIELAAETGKVKIVGIEGGEHPAFKDAPHYDPAAIQHERVIIAAFNTGRDLPQGKTRVARIHVQITGNVEPEYAVRLEVAAAPDGRRVEATATLAKGERP